MHNRFIWPSYPIILTVAKIHDHSVDRHNCDDEPEKINDDEQVPDIQRLKEQFPRCRIQNPHHRYVESLDSTSKTTAKKKEEVLTARLSPPSELSLASPAPANCCSKAHRSKPPRQVVPWYLGRYKEI